MKTVTKKESAILENIKKTLQIQFKHESSGHDWWHIYRVYKIASSISDATKEDHSRFIVELGALLHDIADWKFCKGDETEGPKQAQLLLTSLSVDEDTITKVIQIIHEVSFKGAQVHTQTSSIESAIVQDADRLDALGAIGIARTFAYGGTSGRPIYDPDTPPQKHASFDAYKKSNSNSINHFYEKLLLLKDTMNTPIGKKMAISRHAFMEEFLKTFYDEWEGKK